MILVPVFRTRVMQYTIKKCEGVDRKLPILILIINPPVDRNFIYELSLYTPIQATRPHSCTFSPNYA